jgi:hypothetical protein
MARLAVAALSMRYLPSAPGAAVPKPYANAPSTNAPAIHHAASLAVAAIESTALPGRESVAPTEAASESMALPGRESASPTLAPTDERADRACAAAALSPSFTRSAPALTRDRTLPMGEKSGREGSEGRDGREGRHD